MPRPIAQDILSKRSQNQLQNRYFPEDIGPHGILFVFRDYDFKSIRRNDRGTAEGTVTRNLSASVLLPLPDNLRSSYSIDLNNGKELGLTGETIANLASTARANGRDAMMSAAVDELKGLMPDFNFGANDEFNSADNVGRVQFLTRKFAEKFGATDGLEVGLGSTFNPKVAVSFEGVKMRSHDFSWSFAPRSAGESEALREITQLIKQKMHPTYQNAEFGSSFGARALFRYPSMVDIYFMGIQEEYFYKFKTCMISDFATNYTPGSTNAILKGGKPAVVGVSMSVTETDIHTSEDFT